MATRRPEPRIGGAGKVSLPAIAEPQPQSEAITSEGVGSGGQVVPIPQEPIPPKPLRTLNLPYERAHMLAMLPRKKWDELTWGAFTGAAAALPSAIDALVHAWKRTPFGLEAFETFQVLIFFGFSVWFIVSFLYSQRERTSQEYLNELYGPPSTTSQQRAATDASNR
jgi:hypothetical protein